MRTPACRVVWFYAYVNTNIILFFTPLLPLTERMFTVSDSIVSDNRIIKSFVPHRKRKQLSHTVTVCTVINRPYATLRVCVHRVRFFYLIFFFFEKHYFFFLLLLVKNVPFGSSPRWHKLTYFITPHRVPVAMSCFTRCASVFFK